MHASMTQGLLVIGQACTHGQWTKRSQNTCIAWVGGGLTLADYPAMSFIFVRLNPNANKLSWAID